MRRAFRRSMGDDAAINVIALERRFRAFVTRGFFGRLKWLLFGR
jgi:hypothetical protein